MRIGEVIGKVTLSKWHPSLSGAIWKVVVPLTLKGMEDKTQGRDEPLVMWDDYGASTGTLIAISEGPEASNPFYPDIKPIDAYNAAIIDNLEMFKKPN
jgi:ethanolamine utilization protein EutN